MPRKSKKVQQEEANQVLVNKVTELENALLQKSAEVHALATAIPVTATPNMVTIGNFSGTLVGIPYEYNGQKRTLIMDIAGPTQTGSLPLDIWIELERSSKLVKEGYIARLDRPYSNPNIIPDVDEFVRTLREKDIESRLEKITNRHVLTRLLHFIEFLPKDQVTGKTALLRQKIQERYFALTNIQLVDEELV